MTFHRTLTAADRRRQRQANARLLAPCLGSSRLVRLFCDITMLVVTRQGMLDTLESLVAGLAARRQERSEMAEPTAVVWDPTYSVLIKPKQINAPNIERIVLQRNGIVIPPEISTLQPSIQVTAMNAKAIINEGSVIFPASAFEPAPNLSLKLIAIPAVGDNIIHVFTNRELHSIR